MRGTTGSESWLPSTWEDVGSTSRATVVNTGADNYDDVVVELTLPVPESWVYIEPEDAQRYRPERPETYAGRALFVPELSVKHAAFAGMSSPRPQRERIDDKRTLIRFPPMHIRPHTPHPTDAVSLLVSPDAAATTIDVEWRITASKPVRTGLRHSQTDGARRQSAAPRRTALQERRNSTDATETAVPAEALNPRAASGSSVPSPLPASIYRTVSEQCRCKPVGAHPCQAAAPEPRCYMRRV